MVKQENRTVITYSTLVIILSSVICFIAYKTDHLQASILSVFTPSLLALIYTAILKGKTGLRELFIKQTVRKIKIKWLFLSLMGIPLVASLAVLTSLNFDVAKFGFRSTQLMPQMMVVLFIAIGEEYGWRGFLLPRLMNTFNVFYSAMILGFIWGVWHVPAYLIGMGVPLQMNFMVFLLWVILGSLFMAWMYYYTRSVLTSLLAHFSANAAFNYLYILPEFTGSMHTFWWFILYMSVMMAVVLFAGRKDLCKVRNKEIRS